MILNNYFRYFGIFVGCLLAGMSINAFLVPNHLLSGGVSGLAIIVYFLTDFPIGVQMLIYNIPILALAYYTLRRELILDLILGAVIFSACVDLTRFLSATNTVTDPMLAAIYGGVFNGIGFGIVFRMNASSGGLDILAMVARKYYSVNLGSFVFATNCLLMLGGAILFGIMPAMYTLLSMFVSATVTNKVVAGFNHKKLIILISEGAEMIAEGIIHEVGRGVTFLHGEGAFSGENKEVIFVVVNLTQIARIKEIVNEYDDKAFMIVLDANEVMGRGFTLPGVKIEALLRERDAKRQIAKKSKEKVEEKL